MRHRGPFRVAGACAVAAIASLALVATPAGAATNKCAKYTPKYKIAEQSRTAVVFENADDIAFGCLFSDGRLRKLPGPDGFGTYFGQAYTLAGNYVAYGVLDQEPAADIYTAAVYVVDLRTGKPTVKNQDGYPVPVNPDPTAEFSFDISAIALTTKGDVAWLADASINKEQSLVVRRVGTKVTVLDRGKDVRPNSFGQSRDGATFYWTRGSTPKSATFS